MFRGALVIGLSLVALVAIGCTRNNDDSTPSPTEAPQPTRSVPVQSPTNPFDLVSTIFPNTPEATGVPTEIPAPEPTPPRSLADAIRDSLSVTPTPLSAGPDQLLFAMDTPLDSWVFDGESIWAHGGFREVKRFNLKGKETGSIQLGRTGGFQLALADDRLWVLDAGEGELREVTLAGETIHRISTPLASHLKLRAGSLWVYSRTQDRMTRYDLDGQLLDSFELDIDSVFDISTDTMWGWAGTPRTLRSFSLAEDPQDVWPLRPGMPLRPSTSTLQLSEGYVWLAGYSPTEFARIEAETGQIVTFQLEMRDGEFIFDGLVFNVGMLVLDDSVWVSYTRHVGTPGDLHLLKRVDVFDLDGNQLGRIELSDPILQTGLLHLPELGEVWMEVTGRPGKRLIQRAQIDEYVK